MGARDLEDPQDPQVGSDDNATRAATDELLFHTQETGDFGRSVNCTFTQMNDTHKERSEVTAD